MQVRGASLPRSEQQHVPCDRPRQLYALCRLRIASVAWRGLAPVSAPRGRVLLHVPSTQPWSQFPLQDVHAIRLCFCCGSTTTTSPKASRKVVFDLTKAVSLSLS